MSIPAVWNYSATRQAMRDHSTRHPFCAFHLVGYRGVGVAVPKGERAVLARLRGLQAAPAAQEMDERFLNVELDRQRFTETADQRDLQDVIVVVIESLRPEVVNPEVMPNLHEFAKESIYCKQHFSNGNSTSFGMFALMSGVESVWFDRPVSERPIMNRVLYQAGYQLAFYGGSTGWAEFEMDGYVRGEHYDEFKIENADLPATDYKVVERTLNFILEGKRLTKEDPATSSPRVGIAYMLATHCRYISEEQDQIFQPAAPENFLIPYSEAMRDQVYNRYKNSARTVDRMIKPLLRDDCIVIVIGDHGESFLEDGSAIHGLRLSKVQNMTPLILGYPGVKPRIIEQRTMHADILPTLFSILKIPVTDPEIFDGCDLTTVDPQTLSDRIFTTTNFMDRTSGLIGPWTLDPTPPFAYRFLCNIGDWQVDYLNPIDDQGYQRDDSRPGGALSGRQLVRDWMIQKIGPEIVREDRPEAELFSEFLRSEDRETRFSALKIANDIARPELYLYDLIVKLTRDNDPEIRVMAKEIVIRTERYVGQN